MATGVAVNQGTFTPVRSSAQMISATPGPEVRVKQYSKRGAAGDRRKVDMFFLMQKYGAKREFLNEPSEGSPETPSKPNKMGFVVRFSLSGAYQALERQEFEASVPQITPVKVVRKRTFLMKKRSALGSIPEGSSAPTPTQSARGSPDLTTNPPDASTAVSRVTTAKSKRTQALEHLKAQNHQKLVWKNLAKKAVEDSSAKGVSNKSGSSPMFAFQKMVSLKLSEQKELNDNTEEESLPHILSRQTSRVLIREISQSDVDLDLDALKEPPEADHKVKGAKPKDKVKVQKSEKGKSKKSKDGSDKKTSKKEEKSNTKSNSGKAGSKGGDLSKAKKMDKKASKLNLQEDDEHNPKSKKKGKKLEAEVYEPFGSKLYQTMMRQTLGGKRPVDDDDETGSMDTLARFLTTNMSSADEETITASEMPQSRLSVSASGSKLNKTLKPKSANRSDSVVANKGATKSISKDALPSGKEMKNSCMSDEEKLREERKRKVCKYLYHMCNCRYIAKPDTLNRLSKKKQNVAGVIEIYGCPPEDQKGDSPIVCPFCTVFPSQRVHAWLDDVDCDEDEIAPHNKTK